MNKINVLALLVSVFLLSCNKDDTNDLDGNPNQYQIKLTKGNYAPLQVKIWLDAAATDQAGVWIDLNNNGTKENGEAITKFGGDPDQSTNVNVFSVGNNQTITIHGKVTGFDCTNSDVSSIDVSKNPALEYLDFQHNTIKAIDLSKNLALKYIECYGNLDLTSLDVSKNLKLTYLSCGNMKLTHLDVSKNSDLQELHCGINDLVSLDVSRNRALKKLSCRSNDLTNLDLSNNTNLEYLNCYNNQFTALNLTSNIHIKGELRVYWNRITDTDQFLNTLPMRSAGDDAKIYLYDERLADNTIPSAAAIIHAKTKNWRLYKFSSTGSLIEF